MKRSTSKGFWDNVIDALDFYFKGNKFYSTETFMTSDPNNGTKGAEIDIKIDYKSVPPHIDDVFSEVEKAVEKCGWKYNADWNGNVLEVVKWDD